MSGKQSMTPDPEEQRLEDNLVQASLAFHRCDVNDDGSTERWRERAEAFGRFTEASEALRAYLARSVEPPPSISDQTLLALRSIALTRDPDVYLTDARRAVRGS